MNDIDKYLDMVISDNCPSQDAVLRIRDNVRLRQGQLHQDAYNTAADIFRRTFALYDAQRFNFSA